MTTPKRGRSLADVLAKQEPVTPAIEATATPAAPPAARSSAPEKPKGVVTYFSPADHDALRDLSHHSRESLQKLGVEAWNLLMEKRGLPPLEGGVRSR